ncbi:MAG TPA: 50S ribosomal protein L30 [Acetobacteraceae bacterium]
MAESPAPPEKTLRLKLVRSVIGGTERQRATVRALGLRKLHQVVEQVDSPTTRGMVQKVAHLVRVVEEQ